MLLLTTKNLTPDSNFSYYLCVCRSIYCCMSCKLERVGSIYDLNRSELIRNSLRNFITIFPNKPCHAKCFQKREKMVDCNQRCLKELRPFMPHIYTKVLSFPLFFSAWCDTQVDKKQSMCELRVFTN